MKRVTWNLRSRDPYYHTFLHIGKRRVHCLRSSFIQFDLRGYAVSIAIGRHRMELWRGWWKEPGRIVISNRLLSGPTYRRLRDENPFKPSKSGTRLKEYANHPYFTDSRSNHNISRTKQVYCQHLS